MSVRRTIVVDGRPHVVEAHGRDDALTARVDGAPLALAIVRDGATWRVRVGGRTVAATIIRDRDAVWIALDGAVYHCVAGDDARLGVAGGARSPRVTAPMPGKVLAVRVEVGQRVGAGDPLVVLEAMKMETIVSAEDEASVQEVHVAAGATIEPGQVLVVLDFG
ncbi:MAG: biotin/lipoyl-binding protein [Deltaproteobacteria bacterium]|nr:biotin/lipoyl-binding protein [Deltaproteobacteria bacterium]